MSQERGQASPSYLPDPLQGLPSPPGVPDALYERSRNFTNAGAQLDDLGRDMQSLLLQSHGPWEGDSERRFHEQTTDRPGIFRRIGAGYRQAGAALKDYAMALEHAQQTYLASRRLADADAFRQLGLRSNNPAYDYDLYSPDRVRARSQLEAAWERLRASSVRTIGVIKALETTLGPRKSCRKPEIYRGRGESIRQAGSEIWEMGTAGLLGLRDMHRLVMPGQAKEAWKQTWDENVSELDRFAKNPLRYLGDEAYVFANIEELRAGNDARWAAGFGYNLLTRGPSKVRELLGPDGNRRRHDDDDEGEESRDKDGKAANKRKRRDKTDNDDRKDGGCSAGG